MSANKFIRTVVVACTALLLGNVTSAAPLKVAVIEALSGPVDRLQSFQPIVNVFV